MGAENGPEMAGVELSEEERGVLEEYYGKMQQWREGEKLPTLDDWLAEVKPRGENEDMQRWAEKQADKLVEMIDEIRKREEEELKLAA